MGLKSFSGVCCTLVHAIAFVCAASSIYFFLGASFEYVLLAFVLFGVALALETVAAVISRDKAAHS